MLDRRRFLAFLALGAAALPAGVRAHHGWDWAEDEEFTLAGTIREARLGNPHGVLSLEAEDGLWEVEVGQPWRNAGAGLTDDLLKPGTAVTIEGHRARDPEARRMKAERVIIAGMLYNLYPDRS